MKILINAPVITLTNVATNNAVTPNFATVLTLLGATAEKPPSKIPIDPNPPNPHKATVTAAFVFCDNALNCGIPNATASFVTNLVANICATIPTSSVGTPIKIAIGLNNTPKIDSSVKPGIIAPKNTINRANE